MNKTLALAFVLGAACGRFQGQCGHDRWPVKTLTDRDRNSVSFNPVRATVRELTSIPIPERAYPQDARMSPVEITTYRVRARLVAIRQEQDGDLHIIVADLERPSDRMVVEIPSAGCAAGTAHEREYRQARLVINAAPLGTIIEIIGVGFFDFIHSVSGGAKNGIELHPVLNIRL